MGATTKQNTLNLGQGNKRLTLLSIDARRNYEPFRLERYFGFRGLNGKGWHRERFC